MHYAFEGEQGWGPEKASQTVAEPGMVVDRGVPLKLWQQPAQRH